MVTAGVLISGSGTNLQAILDRIADGIARLSRRASSSPTAPAPAAWSAPRRAGVPTRVLDHRAFPSREAYDAALVDALRDAGVELVVLAGFDRLVTRVLLEAFPAAS